MNKKRLIAPLRYVLIGIFGVIGLLIVISIIKHFRFLASYRKDIDLVNPEYVEDTYMLNLKEDNNDYLKDNIVEAISVIPVSNFSKKGNNRALLALKEMYNDNKDYQDLILRRGFLSEEDSLMEEVKDHKSGYDFDFYVRGEDWEDFKGNDVADDLIKNSYKYGFVLRYPKKKDYQPWHYRFVGKASAKIIHDKKLTIDTYTQKLEKLKKNKIYKVSGTTYLLYVTSKEDITVPKYYNYEVSSINDKDYAVIFNTEKEAHIKEIKDRKVTDKLNINKLKVSYDLALINKDNMLPANLVKARKLVSLTKYLNEDNNAKYLLDEEALKSLKPLIDKTNKIDRHKTYLTSAFRTSSAQKDLYDTDDREVYQKPGYSEHETGLAFDIASSYKHKSKFLETLQGKYFDKHAHEYGFILRYPKDKETVTGVKYEPFHYRYTGKLAATIMKENNLTLEEFIKYFEKDKVYEVKYNKKNYVLCKSTLKGENIKAIKNCKNIYYLYGDTYLSIGEK